MKEGERNTRANIQHTPKKFPPVSPIRFHSIMHQFPNDSEVIPEETFESDRIKGTYEDDSQE